MPLCGCFPECACQLNVEPPELLSLTGTGDPLTGGWTLTAIETPLSIDHLNGGLSVTPAGSYGHNPQIELQLDNSGSVELSVSSATGLRADVTTVPSGAGGVPSGVSLSYHGATAPDGYLLEYGQLVDIADYPDLFAAIGHVGNGGVDPGGGQFRIPEGRGLFDLGRDNMGGVAANNVTGATTLGSTGGNEDAQLGVLNLPAHSHTETGSHSHPLPDLNHNHTASSTPSGSHAHTLVQTTPGNPAITNGAQLLLGTVTNTLVQSGVGSGVVSAVGVNPLQNVTSTDGSHDHPIAVNNSTTLASLSTNENADLVTVDGGGNGAAQGNAFLILPPYRVVNKIIKT